MKAKLVDAGTVVSARDPNHQLDESIYSRPWGLAVEKAELFVNGRNCIKAWPSLLLRSTRIAFVSRLASKARKNTAPMFFIRLWRAEEKSASLLEEIA
jgi:hypothetical protein